MPERSVFDTLLLLPDDRKIPSVKLGMGLVSVPEGASLTAMTAEAMTAGRTELPTLRRDPARKGDEAVWRGTVALALLCDSWEEDAALRVIPVDGSGSVFARSALFAAGCERLQLAVLHWAEEDRLLGLADEETVLALPATGEDWRGVLPDRLTWIDGETGRLTDPCALLNQRERHILIARLEMLQGNEMVRRFIGDLRAVDEAAMDAAFSEEHGDDWLTAMKVLVGLSQEKGFDALEAIRSMDREPGEHPLLTALGIRQTPIAEEPEQRIYLWQDRPFARTNNQLGLEPVPGEALDSLREACGLLERYSRRYDREAAARLGVWLQTVGVKMDHEARSRLQDVQSMLQELAAAQPEPLTLVWPWHTETPALTLLLHELLEEDDITPAMAPFADRLTLMPDAMLGDPMLNSLCRIFADGGYQTVLPPLSAALAARLSLVPEVRQRVMNSLRIMPEAEGVTVSLTMTGAGEVRLQRSYPMQEALRWTAEQVPQVSLWPSVPVDPIRWKCWYISLRGDVTLSFVQDGAWTRIRDDVPQPEEADADAAAGEAATEEAAPAPAAYRVYDTNFVPAFVALHRGDECLGVLCYQATLFQPAFAGEAVAALDLGATGVAMALRLGEVVEPVSMPSLWHVMLRGPQEDLIGEQLPVWPLGPVIPAAVCLTDDEHDDPEPFLHGMICLEQAIQARRMADRPPCADVLWRSDAEAARARKLLMREVMLLTSFHAVMHGAQSISWRVCLPQAMALDGRRRLLEELRRAADWCERTCGLIQAAGAMVQEARGSLCAASYLRTSGTIHGAHVMLDVGGSDTTITLWLRGMNKPAAENRLHLGVTSMLLPALMEQPTLYADDLTGPLLPRETLLADTGTGWDAWSRRRLLTEQLLGTELYTTSGQMNARLYEGRCTVTGALLMFGFAELMALTGLTLEQVYQNVMLNDYLPQELTLCLCGRGSRVLEAMDPQLQQSLVGFTRAIMSPEHPVRFLYTTASRAPKLEAALGLAEMQRLPDAQLPSGSTVSDSRMVLNMLAQFLGQFAVTYPQAAALLMPGLLEADGMFSEVAEDRVRQAAYQSHGTVQERFVWGVELVRSLYAADRMARGEAAVQEETLQETPEAQPEA